MTIIAPELAVSPVRSARRLDERLARAAVLLGLDPESSSEDAARRLLLMADGNRTAVERALSRVESNRLGPDTPTAGRAAAMLRLTLARGTWAW